MARSILTCALALSALASALPGRSALAQTCTPNWLAGQALPGVDGEVFAFSTWDPPGRVSERLVVAGNFKIAGSILANSIATWNGATWETLGTGMPGGTVRDLAVYNGQLIAAGSFTTAGGTTVNNIARWDGTSWQPLGDGLTGGYMPARALIVHAGLLFAAGDFTTAGGSSVQHIACWDGTTWEPLGTGINNVIEDLTVYGTDLIAAGSFSIAGDTPAANIARWDGTQWHNLGTGTNSNVFSLCTHNGDLIAGGLFTTAGSSTVASIARWNGTDWQPLGDGLNREVHALLSYGGNLIAGGQFNASGGTKMSCVARWTGAAWEGMSTGLEAPIVFINALAVFKGDLFVGGFQKPGSGEDDSDWYGVLRWNGKAWQSPNPGFNGRIQTICTDSTNLYAGGEFTQSPGGPSSGVARFDGNIWYPLGDGLTTPVGITRPLVYALTMYNGDLIAAGTFSRSGITFVSNVARWNGSDWQSIGGGLSGTVAAPIVYALTVYNGELIAAGFFSSSNTSLVANIARWDGSAWQPLGSGLNGVVRALIVHGNQLIAAGLFTSAGGVPVNRIARWNGTTWQPMGDGFNNAVFALTTYGRDLVAGGAFTFSGAKPDVNRIARWDGTDWQAMATGMDNTVNGLSVFDGDLIAGGAFSTADGNDGGEAKRIARWNGSTWSALNGGLDAQLWPQVLALAPFHGQLIAGGTFTYSNNGAAGFWTRWGCPCPPNRTMDLDWDCDIDATDFDLLVQCGTGPGLYHDGSSTCLKADVDDDGDVDSRDFAVFQRCLTANHQPATTDCHE